MAGPVGSGGIGEVGTGALGGFTTVTGVEAGLMSVSMFAPLKDNRPPAITMTMRVSKQSAMTPA
jgi:hypothetical protein